MWGPRAVQGSGAATSLHMPTARTGVGVTYVPREIAERPSQIRPNEGSPVNEALHSALKRRNRGVDGSML